MSRQWTDFDDYTSSDLFQANVLLFKGFVHTSPQIEGQVTKPQFVGV